MEDRTQADKAQTDKTQDYKTQDYKTQDYEIQNNALGYIDLRKHVERSRLLAVGILIGAMLTYLLNPFPMMVEVNWERERRHLKFDNRDKHWCPLPNSEPRDTEEKKIASF